MRRLGVAPTESSQISHPTGMPRALGRKPDHLKITSNWLGAALNSPNEAPKPAPNSLFIALGGMKFTRARRSKGSKALSSKEDLCWQLSTILGDVEEALRASTFDFNAPKAKVLKKFSHAELQQILNELGEEPTSLPLDWLGADFGAP